ncbi:hypothetical protein HO173_006134 [Letharia columbiana]|uniref:RING-type domain-containing protein n=1 Tax=Letharia columbiana TaxID=112416 RepID=A0A8H6FVI7_9LECA|nr:uncharacterized protein HO173_006134 [Letharia columbiana]KAF6235451.1 hypothetical protein HO173_006134 [Letharia columbiana]
MDRKQFVSQLLRRENSVQVEEGQECLICKEEYGARSSETGTAERQIRLPCNPKHTVGSKCITAWLQAHNTCPVCRYEFFPAERSDKERAERLYIGFADDDDSSDEGEDTDDEYFSDEGGETDDEDENMDDEDSEEDDEYEKDDNEEE